MSARLTRRLVAIAGVALVATTAGCGSSDSGDQTTQPAQVTQATPTNAESGSQANGGFPGAGSPTAPNVTTTPGSTVKEDPQGQAGGGSGATCIGC
jgi:hypothetical protein